jgi:hypothetical protein
VIFSPLLPHCQIQHIGKAVKLVVNGDNLLQKHIFYSWSTFPIRCSKQPTNALSHLPCGRVDPTMIFSYYGQSPSIPHLRVGFTWDRYIWQPVQNRYEAGIGVVDKFFYVQ